MARHTLSRARIALLGVLVACGSSGPPRLSSAPLDSAWASPKRPRMPEAADTNSADAYEEWGRQNIVFAPDTAAAAFYWASRLDPWRATPYYERGIALLRAHVKRLRTNATVDPWNKPEQLSVAQAALLDSLNDLAMVRDPFLQRSFDGLIAGAPFSGDIARIRDPAVRGYWLFTRGAYDTAVVDLGKALQKKPDLGPLRIMRAIAFYHLERYDSTAAELDTTLTRVTALEQKKTVVFYRSKAMIHYAMGIALVQKHDEHAREHFEAALVEDLSFYMAHVRLAGLALERTDTTAALASLSQALDIKDDDPALHYFYGLILQRRDRPAATKAFTRAVALDPYFAPPHLQLAVAADLRGDTTAAIAAYDRFVSLTASGDPLREKAKGRRETIARKMTP